MNCIQPQFPEPEWYAAFRSRKFRYRSGGDFVAGWVNDQSAPRYINIVHFTEQREQIIEGLTEIAAATSGGTRALFGGGTSHQFYGRMFPDAPYSSVRVDQRPLLECMSTYPRGSATHGDHVTTFRIGRSHRGKLFGLHCAFSVLEWPMIIDVPQSATSFRFGKFHLFGKSLNTAELSRRYLTIPGSAITEKFTAEFFEAPQTICLQVRGAHDAGRFLERETAAEIKRMIHLLVSQRVATRTDVG